ncbi:hypothetical protein IAR50_007600 [Cryptococcus sp. DSM 104548]
MQADKGKGKETKPAFQVTALEGTPRLSIKNPPQPSGSAYWSNSPAWVDAISGRPANPDHHRKHSDGSVDDFHFRHFDRVHDSSHHIGYGSEAQYLVVPGLTEDGRLVYQTVHCSRNRETYDPALYPDPNKPHPNWWDEQMSKSTQWFLKFRENGGMQPPAEDSEVPKVTDAEGNLITDEEAKQKVLSMWSSVIGPDLDNGIETKGHKHTPWGVFRPRASIITKTDVSSLLAHNFLHFGDGPKPPVTRITFNGDYSPDLDNVILRVKEMSEEARKRRTNAPTKGSSYLLIHSEYSKSWLPRTTSILAYPSQIDDLDKLSTKARILCDKTDQEATAHLEQTIKNATIAFTLFDKDPGHSKAIEERIIPYHNQGYQHGRLDPERRATALSKYISASVLQALNEQDRFSSTQSGSHITPCVSVPFSDYTWDEALKTGWIENKYLSAQSPGMVEAILADTERRLALHTGTGSREQGEAPPPSYDATMGYETRFALNTGDVGSSSATSGQPGDPRQNKYSAAGKNKPVSDENDDIIPGPVTAAAGEDSSSIDAAAQYGVSHLSPSQRINVTQVSADSRSPRGTSRRRRVLSRLCGGDDYTSDDD